MTVAELIKELEKYPPDYKVALPFSRSEFSFADGVKYGTICSNDICTFLEEDFSPKSKFRNKIDKKTQAVIIS